MKKYKYYAVFTKTDDAVEVDFPDLKGCVTFGDDFEDAFEMAVDVLSAWLVSAEEQFIKPPSPYEQLKKRYNKSDQTIFPVLPDKAIMDSYEPKKRINVVFPADTLSKLDELRAKRGERDRSKFLTGIIKDFLNSADDLTFKT